MSNLSRRSNDDIFSYLPAGTVLPFAGANAPDGWALCDGTTVSRSEYASLYMAIGDAWGNGDGSTTFHLPDMRGKFMRGTDNLAGVDPEAGGRTPSNAGGNVGDNVGSVQSDATKKSSLTASSSSSSSTSTSSSPQLRYSNTWKYTGIASNGYSEMYVTGKGGSVYYDQAYGFSSSTSTSTSTSINGGDLESRPVNANVNYIIKL